MDNTSPTTLPQAVKALAKALGATQPPAQVMAEPLITAAANLLNHFHPNGWPATPHMANQFLANAALEATEPGVWRYYDRDSVSQELYFIAVAPDPSDPPSLEESEWKAVRQEFVDLFDSDGMIEDCRNAITRGLRAFPRWEEYLDADQAWHDDRQERLA